MGKSKSRKSRKSKGGGGNAKGSENDAGGESSGGSSEAAKQTLEFKCIKYTTQMLIVVSICAEIYIMVILIVKPKDASGETSSTTDLFVVAPLWLKLATGFIIILNLLGLVLVYLEHFLGCLLYSLLVWLVIVFNAVRVHHQSVIWWLSVVIHIVANISILFFLFEINLADRKAKSNSNKNKQ